MKRARPDQDKIFREWKSNFPKEPFPAGKALFTADYLDCTSPKGLIYGL